jgi:DNA-binding transcriptional LysR family regulator
MRALPSLSDLEYFLEIVRTENLSRAAERLHVRQSTLSGAARRLEEQIGTPLLVRSKTGVRTTRAGARFATEARRLVEEWRRVTDVVTREHDEIRGRFTLGCHESIGIHLLPSFVPELAKERPNVELTIHHDYSRLVIESVVSERLDFGIATNPPRHPELVLRKLYDEETGLWQSPRQGDRSVLVYDPMTVETEPIVAALGSAKFKRFLAVSSLETIGAIVAAGAGVGALPGQVARRWKLAPFGPAKLTQTVAVHLAYRTDTQRSRAAKFLATFIEARARTQP